MRVGVHVFKIQFDRRNMSSRTKTYLVGRRYLIEKNENGGDRKSDDKNYHVISGKTTRQLIAEQLHVGEVTVQNAAKFTLAVDRIVEVTGIRVKHT